MEESILDAIPLTGDDDKLLKSRSKEITRKALQYNEQAAAPEISSEFDYARNNAFKDNNEALAYFYAKDGSPEEINKEHSWMKDAWYTLLNSKNNIELQSQSSSLIDVNSAKKKIKNKQRVAELVEKLDELYKTTPGSPENKRVVDQQISGIEAEINDIVSRSPDDYTDWLNIKKDKIFINQDQSKRQAAAAGLPDEYADLEKDEAKIRGKISKLQNKLKERRSAYKNSGGNSVEFDYFQSKYQNAGLTDLDYWMYEMPGIIGSSATAWQQMAGGMAINLGKKLAIRAAISAGTGGAAALPSAVLTGIDLATIGGTIAMDIYSRINESKAEAFGAYQERIERDLQRQGIQLRDYINTAREQLKAEGQNYSEEDVTDEEILRRITTGEIAIDDPRLEEARSTAKFQADAVFKNNIWLSGSDVLQTALMYRGIGAAFKKVLLGLPGKYIPGVAKLSKNVRENVLSPIVDFNNKIAYNYKTVKIAEDILATAARLGVSSIGEMYEEANQGIFKTNAVEGEYSKHHNYGKALLDLFGADIRSTKLFTHLATDDNLANDQEFWNDARGGFAMGLLMGSPVSAASTTSKIYEDMKASNFVQDLVANRMIQQEDVDRMKEYAKAASATKVNPVLGSDVMSSIKNYLEMYKSTLPKVSSLPTEGTESETDQSDEVDETRLITRDMIDSEIELVEDIWNRTRSRKNNKLREKLGYDKGSDDYGLFISLQKKFENDRKTFGEQAREAENKLQQIFQKYIKDSGINLNDQEIGSKWTKFKDLITLAKSSQLLDEENEDTKTVAKNNKNFSKFQKYLAPLFRTALTMFLATHSPNLLAADSVTVDDYLNEELNTLYTEFQQKGFTDDILDNVDLAFFEKEMRAFQEAEAAKKIREMSGVTLTSETSTVKGEDGKDQNVVHAVAVPFEKANEKQQKAALEKIKSIVDEYKKDANESAAVAERNSKDYVENQQKAEAEKKSTETPATPAQTTEQTSSVQPETTDETTPAVEETPTSSPPVNAETNPSTTPSSDEVSSPAQDPQSIIDELSADDVVEENESSNLPSPTTENTVIEGKTQEVDKPAVTEEEKKQQPLPPHQPEEPTRENETEENGKPEEKPQLALPQGDNPEWHSPEEVEDFDGISNVLFFNPTSTAPLIEGLKPGEELAERINDPDFLEKSTYYFAIDTKYNEEQKKAGKSYYRPGDESTYAYAPLVVIFEHPSGKYAMTLRTPETVKRWITANMLNDPNLSEEEKLARIANSTARTEAIIKRLNNNRRAVIRGLEQLKEGEMLVPQLQRSNGQINSQTDSNGRAIIRPISEVNKLFQKKPTTKWGANSSNITFGVGKGFKGGWMILGSSGEPMSAEGGVAGQLYIYPPASSTLSGISTPIMVNVQRFNDAQAEIIYKLLTSDDPAAVDMLDFLAYYGNRTEVGAEDRMQFKYLHDIQFFFRDPSHIQIGTNIYDITDKAAVIEAIKKLHFRVGLENFFGAFPADIFSTQNMKNVFGDKYEEVSKTLGLPPANVKNVTTISWFLNNNLITTDVGDNLFVNPFTYVMGLDVVSKGDVKSQEKTTSASQLAIPFETEESKDSKTETLEEKRKRIDEENREANRAKRERNAEAVDKLRKGSFRTNVVSNEEYEKLISSGKINYNRVYERYNNLLDIRKKFSLYHKLNEEEVKEACGILSAIESDIFNGLIIDDDTYHMYKEVKKIIRYCGYSYLDILGKFYHERNKGFFDFKTDDSLPEDVAIITGVYKPFIFDSDGKVVQYPTAKVTIGTQPLNKTKSQSNTTEETKSESTKESDLTKEDIDQAEKDYDDIFGAFRKVESRETTETVSEEEITWFKDVLGLSGESLTIVEDAIALGGNERAMGLVRTDSTTLWQGAEKGTLYHEAYHRVSLFLISPRERKKIYDLYRNRHGYVGTDQEVEELLAEDFRHYMLTGMDPELNILKRIWKAIKHFVSKWVFRTDTTLDNIYERIANKYYNRTKQRSDALEAYLKEYEGKEGAPFLFRQGIQLENISTSQFNEIIGTLQYALFKFEPVEMKDGSKALDYERLKKMFNPENNKRKIAKKQITEAQKAVQDEIYEKFDTVFKPQLQERLGKLKIATTNNINKQTEEEEIEAKSEGEFVADAMSYFNSSPLEISTKDNALSAVKIRISSLPKYVKKDGVWQLVKNPLLGLPTLVDFNIAWNGLMKHLHGQKSFEGIVNKTRELRDVNPIFYSFDKLLQSLMNPSKDETEEQRIARENMKTMLVTTFNKAYHKLISVLMTKEQQDTLNTKARVYEEQESRQINRLITTWNSNLISFSPNDLVLEVLDEVGEPIYSSNNKEINNVRNRVGKLEQILALGTGVNKDVALRSGKNNANIFSLLKNFTIKNEQNQYLTGRQIVEKNINNIVNEILAILSSFGINTDSDALWNVIATYGGTNAIDNFFEFIKDASSETSFTKFVDSALDKLNKVENTGKINGTNNLHFSKIYHNNQFLINLASAHLDIHPYVDEASVRSSDNKLLYPVSEHNYFSDVIDRYNTDFAFVKSICNVLYAAGDNTKSKYIKGSAILDYLLNHEKEKDKLIIETLSCFKDNTQNLDRGRKYTQISPLEDYVMRMGLTFDGRLCLPVTGDSAVFNVLSGSAIKLFGIEQDAQRKWIKNITGVLQPHTGRFNDDVLKRFKDYFETELDTLKFNYENESSLTDSQKIVNYDTKNRNGYRFRYFGNMKLLNETRTLNEMLEDGKKSQEGGEAIMLGMILDAWNNKLSDSAKLDMMNDVLQEALNKELKFAEEIGLVNRDSDGNFIADTRVTPGFYYNQFKLKHQMTTANNFVVADSILATKDLIATHAINTIVGNMEFEKLVVKDPAYFKDSVDKVKRLRGLLSTGTSPIAGPNDNGIVRTTTLSDNKVISRSANKLKEVATKSALIQILTEQKGMQYEAAVEAIKNNTVPEDAMRQAKDLVESKFGAYFTANTNQTDATVLISPKFYERLMRGLGKWTPEIEEAYKILNEGVNRNGKKIDIEHNVDAYFKALAAALQPLKLVYYDDHIDMNTRRDVPIFDKMAMFPLHKLFTDGDAAELLKAMEEQDIDMIAFDSAVKVGQHANEVANTMYANPENTVLNDFSNLPTHNQRLSGFRQQLITDPHSSDRQMFVTQAQKVMMGNIRPTWVYNVGNKTLTGEEVIKNIVYAQNTLTRRGLNQVRHLFSEGKAVNKVTKSAVLKEVRNAILNRNGNDNLVNGLQRVIDGEIPLSGLSDLALVESIITSIVNREVIDKKLPGGMFIQMSSVTYNTIATAGLSSNRVLNFHNDDNSMDCVISINLLKHFIPDYKKKTFAEAKEWLIKNNIVGDDAGISCVGYRTPTQGKTSTVALRIKDVWPEHIGDTITLPDEFTTLTGSDFDIDKLFVTRYNYDNEGNKIEMMDKKQYKKFLADRYKYSDEEAEAAANAQYLSDDFYNVQSREAVENMLLDMYVSILTADSSQMEGRQPLDLVTQYLKGEILAKVEEAQGISGNTNSGLSLLGPAFQSATKDELNTGKIGIGPFALHNSHHALTQIAGLTFGGLNPIRKYGAKDVAGIMSRDGSNLTILDYLSAMVSAHVDVAKDPYISRLNINNATYNMCGLLLRAGFGENTFYFLAQPALKEYASLVRRFQGKWGVETAANARRALQEIKNKYRNLALAYAEGLEADNVETLTAYTRDREVLYKKAVLLSRKSFFDKDSLLDMMKPLNEKAAKKEKYKYYFDQLRALQVFEELNAPAQGLSTIMKLSQIDTKKFGKTFGLQEVFMSNFANYFVFDQTFSNKADLFTKTFLGEMFKDSLSFIHSEFPMLSISDSVPFKALRNVINGIVGYHYGRQDLTYMNKLSTAISALLKTRFFTQYLKEKKGTTLNELLYGTRGKPSVAQRFNKLKQRALRGEFPELLDSANDLDNTVFRYITLKMKTNDYEQAGPWFLSYNAHASTNGDFENGMIRGWQELYDSPHKELKEFAEDLALYAYFTSGDGFGANNLFKFVPNSIRESIGYFDYMKRMEEDPFVAFHDYINETDVIESMWYDDLIVPAFDYEDIDIETGETIHLPTLKGVNNITMENKDSVPPFIVDTSYNNIIIGKNEDGMKIHTPYKKLKLRGADPRSIYLYRYIGLQPNYVGSKFYPVYALIRKKGLNINGNVVVESMDSNEESAIPYNNIPETEFTDPSSFNYTKHGITPIYSFIPENVFNGDPYELIDPDRFVIKNNKETESVSEDYVELIPAETLNKLRQAETNYYSPDWLNRVTSIISQSVVDPQSSIEAAYRYRLDHNIQNKLFDAIIEHDKAAEAFFEQESINGLYEKAYERWKVTKNNNELTNLFEEFVKVFEKNSNVEEAFNWYKNLSDQPSNVSEQKETKKEDKQNKPNKSKKRWGKTSKNGFEVSTAGDELGSKFSAKNATFANGTHIVVRIPTYNGSAEVVDIGGRTIEDVYQNIIKKSGKNQAPSENSPLHQKWMLNGEQTATELEDYSYYNGYLPLYHLWSLQNEDLMKQLSQKVGDNLVLTDKFAKTRVTQARALSDLLFGDPAPESNSIMSFADLKDAYIKEFSDSSVVLEDIKSFTGYNTIEVITNYNPNGFTHDWYAFIADHPNEVRELASTFSANDIVTMFRHSKMLQEINSGGVDFGSAYTGMYQNGGAATANEYAERMRDMDETELRNKLMNKTLEEQGREQIKRCHGK